MKVFQIRSNPRELKEEEKNPDVLHTHTRACRRSDSRQIREVPGPAASLRLRLAAAWKYFKHFVTCVCVCVCARRR